MAKKTKILVVEDEGISAKYIESYLTQQGYFVSGIVSSGKEAIECSKAVTPDLVLMDIIIKGTMDGIKTAEILKRDFSVPVIYLTAFCDDSTINKALLTEPFGYILKPFEEKDLRIAIEIALYKHKMEMKLRQNQRELEIAYNKLKQTQDNLIKTEKFAAIGRFSSNLAHEIRNPLANISASAQFLAGLSTIDEKIKKHLEVIKRNAEAANRIIKDILEFASPRPLNLKKGNIEKVIESICDMARTRCENQGVIINTKIDGEVPSILLNEQKLGEAFMNFVSNAIEAMPEGGNLNISSFKDNESNEVVMMVRDTGVGISQENLEKIFEPFFTTKEKGTGLGLSLAFRTISAHSGSLHVKSKIKEGTEFEIRFPI